ncbi:MAG TPA: hypothetical protein VGE27_06950 [Gemmatimonas sp.]|uniref:hypothetical protein n=1 Tax=Gemmatimonas sp. TaxID=1962908 RepID=UPI002ED91065
MFTCSTRQTHVRQKILDDVAAVMGGQERPQVVYHFTTADVAVAVRHELQAQCRATYGASLEIFDLQALGDMLADRDLFPVASQYLHLPASLLPAIPAEDPSWYATTRMRWTSRDGSTANIADFDDLRTAIRYAGHTEGASGDVAMWAQRLREYAARTASPRVARIATYERTYATWYARETLRGLEGDLRAYFEDCTAFGSAGELEDASTLLTLLAGSVTRCMVDLSPAEVGTWQRAMSAVVADRLALESGFSERAQLLATAGFGALLPDVDGEHRMLDLDQALIFWSELVAQVHRAPLFALDAFADRMGKMAPMLDTHPGYDDFVQQLDQATAVRSGQRAVAKQATSRAFAFARADRPLRAIHELHQAKVDWFTSETLRSSLAAMVLLCDWYRQLGMTFAAKRYGLAAAYLAATATEAEAQAYAPKAMSRVTLADFQQGAWVAALGDADATVGYHAAFAPRDSRGDTETDIDLLGYVVGHITACVEAFLPDAVPAVAAVTTAWGQSEWLATEVELARDIFGADLDAFWAEMSGRLFDAAFSDAGVEGEVVWDALGLRFTARYANDARTVPLAEEFLAALQIVLSDLEEQELLLVPTRVMLAMDVHWSETEPPTVSLTPLPSNASRSWALTLRVPERMPHAAMREWESLLLGGVLQILRETTLLPAARFDALLERLMRRNMPGKVSVALPYHVLYTEMLGTHRFYPGLRMADMRALRRRPLPRPMIRELAWSESLGPGYDAAAAAERIKRRYTRGLPPCRQTLARLRLEPDFVAAVEALRSEGWKDWHILVGVSAIILNTRNAAALQNASDPQAAAALLSPAMDEVEPADAPPLPVSLFSTSRLRTQMQLNMLNEVRGCGLELHQRTPDLEGLQRFFAVRYRYLSDDQPHPADLLTPAALS